MRNRYKVLLILAVLLSPVLIVRGEHIVLDEYRALNNLTQIGAMDSTDIILEGGSVIFDGNNKNIKNLKLNNSASTFEFSKAGNDIIFESGEYIGGSLTINNWEGKTGGGGSDRILFQQTPSAEFLDNVNFNGYTPGSIAVSAENGCCEIIPFGSLSVAMNAENGMTTGITGELVSLAIINLNESPNIHSSEGIFLMLIGNGGAFNLNSADFWIEGVVGLAPGGAVFRFSSGVGRFIFTGVVDMGGSLIIEGWEGDIETGSSTRQVCFTSPLPSSFLRDVQFDGYAPGARLIDQENGAYELVPYSEIAGNGSAEPILEGIIDNENGTFTAYWSYKNKSPNWETVPVGPSNTFSSAPIDRGQPTNFKPGRSPFYPNSVFSTDFNTGDSVTWTLNGKSVTADENSKPIHRTFPTDTGFHDQWENKYFTVDDVNQGLNDDCEDPDGDGVCNLMEYALNTNPKSNANSSSPGIQKKDAVSDWTYTFTRDIRRSELIYKVQVSSDLQNWDTIAQSVNGETTEATSPYQAIEDGIGNMKNVEIIVGDASLVQGIFTRLEITR